MQRVERSVQVGAPVSTVYQLWHNFERFPEFMENGGMTGILRELPVSDISYDLITALQSKLEALTVYETFVEDCRDAGDQRCVRMFEEIWRDDERHAQTLAAELERVIQEGNLHGRRAA